MGRAIHHYEGNKTKILSSWNRGRKIFEHRALAPILSLAMPPTPDCTDTPQKIIKENPQKTFVSIHYSFIYWKGSECLAQTSTWAVLRPMSYQTLSLARLQVLIINKHTGSPTSNELSNSLARLRVLVINKHTGSPTTNELSKN